MLRTLFRGFPFFLRLKTNEKKKKRERHRTNKSTLEKRNAQKEDLPSNGLRISIRTSHPLHKRFFSSFSPPCSNDNSRFIGIHIHRRDRTPRYSSNEQVTRRNGTFKRRSIGGPVEKESPYSPPLCGNYEADIRSTPNYHLNCKKPIRVYNSGELFGVGSHKFANCWSAVRDGSGSRSREINPGNGLYSFANCINVSLSRGGIAPRNTFPLLLRIPSSKRGKPPQPPSSLPLLLGVEQVWQRPSFPWNFDVSSNRSPRGSGGCSSKRSN